MSKHNFIEPIEERISARINRVIGGDCKQLYRASELVDHYRSCVELIKRNLGEECGFELTSNVKSALKSQKISAQTFEFQIETVTQFEEKLAIKIQASEKEFQHIVKDLLSVHWLQQLVQYLKIIQDVQEISHSLTSAIQGKDEAKMVNIFLTLFEDNDCENSVIGRLNDIQASHLKLFSTNIAIYWHKLLSDRFASHSLTSAIQGKDEAKMVNIFLTLFEDNDCENSVIGRLNDIQASHLKLFSTNIAIYWHKLLSDRFARELEYILKAMRWGFKECDFVTFSPSRDNTIKAQLIAEYLFLIKSPVEELEPLVVITPSITCQPVNTITQLLLAPYRQRFQYHFTGIRQTNRLDKPEWYFTQVLNWGKEVHLFVGKTFQPAAVKAGKLNYNIRLEFIRGLVQLIVEKLAVDIEEITHDELLFAHLLDEILAFETELRETFGYPSSFPSAICVVTQPAYLLKWISLEERFCSEKMDLILHGENPWIPIGENLHDNDLKIPKCADQFMRLLEAIKDRYYTLIQPGHQLQFLSLQLDLIENFRRRLVQLHSCGEVGSVSILNAINYLALVLSEWGENVHYLHLHVALVGPNSTEIHSVFDEPVRELKHWTQELIENLATRAVNEIKAKSMFYRHDCWSTMPEQNRKEPFILSPSAGEMFQVMVTTLHNLERELSVNIFYLTLRIIANQVDDFLFESLVMNNKFTPGGAAQFSYDMSRNLFALFGQYCRRPELLFKRVDESNKLLNTTRGTALLLYETLITETPIDQKMDALRDLGIVNFKYQACLEILDRRTDIRKL